MVMLIAPWALWQFRRTPRLIVRGVAVSATAIATQITAVERAVARYYAVIGGEHYVPAPKGTSE